MYSFLSDVILTIHVLFVLFVVLGLVLIYAGYCLKWRCVRNLRFRILHLIAIVIVVIQSWLGIICPLTTLEMWLRDQAGQTHYSGSFIQHWLQSLLYYEAPSWVFVVVYTGFGALVAASWFVVRPQSPQKHIATGQTPR